MPKIPVLSSGAQAGQYQPAPANAKAFGAPFGELAADVAAMGQKDAANLEYVRNANLQAGNAINRAGMAAASARLQSNPGPAIASAVGDIAQIVHERAKTMALQDQAVDLANRRAGAAKESLDWYQQEIQNAQGQNAQGLTDRTKAKLDEISAKYGDGLRGVPLAQFQLHQLATYETLTKSAASREAAERQLAVGNQQKKAIGDAIALGVQASDPADLDKVLATMGATIDSLHPGEDMSATKQQAMTKVIDGVMRVKASAKDFQGAQQIAGRYASMNIVDPGSVATVNTLRNQAIAESRAEARHAEAMARADRLDRQDKTAFQMHMAYKSDPKVFVEKYNPPAIAAMVQSGALRPAQGSALIDALTGADRQSDPVARDEAYRLAATGDLSREWIEQHGASLSGPDLFNVTGRLNSQTKQSVDGRTMGLFVNDMFRTSLRFNRMDPEAMQTLHENQVSAQDFATKRLEEGTPLDQVKAETRLKYDPEIGESAPVPKSRYASAIPPAAGDLQPSFDRLFQSDARTMDPATWKREFRALLTIRDIAEKRAQLTSQIRQSKGASQ